VIQVCRTDGEEFVYVAPSGRSAEHLETYIMDWSLPDLVPDGEAGAF
jgi:hypothetical protein